ncbi:MAG: PadR family transcriptional regulator [Gemmatimonadota bacterium]
MAAKPSTPRERSDVIKGTLDMLILQSLTVQSMHGYAILQHIERVTDDSLSVEGGSLYPALERLQKKGWVTSKVGASPTGRSARYYTITAAGRRQLGKEVSDYERAIWAIGRVLGRA